MHSVPIWPNFGKKSISWLKIYPSGWLSARWKRNLMLFEIKKEIFKNFHFSGVWGQITIFGHFGQNSRKSTKTGILWQYEVPMSWLSARWKRNLMLFEIKKEIFKNFHFSGVWGIIMCPIRKFDHPSGLFGPQP